MGGAGVWNGASHASAFRILERLHPGQSSRENKLQILAHMGKCSCLQRQLALGTLAGTEADLALVYIGSDMEPS